MGATGDISLKLMIFLTGLVLLAVLIALESPGIHSIYSGINAGVSKSGLSLIIDKLNDIYDKYYLWTLNHDEETDKFDYETQFNVMLSPGVYILYPDKQGYYRIDYYSETSIDVYKLSITAIDTPDKFNEFIKDSNLVTSEYVGFRYNEFTIQGVCQLSDSTTRALIFFVDKSGSKVIFNIKVVKLEDNTVCKNGGTIHQLAISIKNADSILTEISYSALKDSTEVD